mgnify:CR=1 FL=1|tara:strand:+ start:250 stop:705 length:456 start_codon:yes stop_codon:yes gene_type:complete
MEYLKVEQIMSAPVLTIDESNTVGEAASKMIENQIGCLPVLSSGNLVGMVSERLFMPKTMSIPFMRGETLEVLGHVLGTTERLTEIADSIKDIFVSEVMREEIPEINSQTKVSEAAKLMLENGLDHLPVLDNKNVIGVISRHDLLKVFTNI